MLTALKFVQGSVAKKDFISALTHFRIENGLIRGFNGNLSLCCPIPLDLTVSPKADQFIKAVQNCNSDQTRLTLTPANRIKITSGKFTAFVDCTTDPFPDIQPDGDIVPPPLDLITTLKTLAPFISEDASRPWSRGVLFAGNVIRATNNIVIVEKWVSSCFPYALNIPRSAIVELIKINKQPISLQLADNSVTFHFENGAWLRTNTLDSAWPDLEGRVFGVEQTGRVELAPDLFDAVETLAPFTDEMDSLFFFNGAVSTSPTGDTGAYIEYPQDFGGAIFGCKYFMSLRNIATEIYMGNHLRPCIFYNADKTLRGAIIGIRPVSK